MPGVRNHEHCITVHMSRATIAPLASHHTPAYAPSVPPAMPCHLHVSQPTPVVVSCSVDWQVAKLEDLTRLVGDKSKITSFFRAKPTAGNT